MAEIQVNVDEDVFECEPVDFGLEDMLEIAASTHVEIIALRPVIDVVVWVKVAHSDLDGTREHFFVESLNCWLLNCCDHKNRKKGGLTPPFFDKKTLTFK